MLIHSLFFSPVSCKHFLPIKNSDSFLLDALPCKEGNYIGSTQLLYKTTIVVPDILLPTQRAWEELFYHVLTSTGMVLATGG
jgi:hypothetical protein